MTKQERIAKLREENPNPDHLKFVTRDRVSVTKRIEDGRTKAFETKEAALKLARQLRTYVYDLYVLVNGKIQFYGYAVPK